MLEMRLELPVQAFKLLRLRTISREMLLKLMNHADQMCRKALLEGHPIAAERWAEVADNCCLRLE